MKCVFCGQDSHMGKPCKKISVDWLASANHKKERREHEGKICFCC